MSFQNLGLAEPVLRAVSAEGYTVPTPIQMQAIPPLLAGRDLLGCAQTGTGKTAAFSLPILHRLAQHKPEGRRPIRALILCPTRELAAQIGESLRVYGRHTGLRHAVIFGGVNQFHQVKALRAGVDIVVATPGRLLDLMNQGHVDLSAVNTFVLDEADRMFDMGFLPDLRRIVVKLPTQRQTMLFSATMPGPIEQLANSVLRNPERIMVVPEKQTLDLIQQSLYHVPHAGKQALLEQLLFDLPQSRVIVFTRTKHGADRVVKLLDRAGLNSAAIHGNKSQAARQRALEGFKRGQLPVLIATDLAARGIDVDDITHVINFDLPHEPETYVHRVGRTGRAGASGFAISFCSRDERDFLRSIERLTRQRIPVNGTPELELPKFKESPEEAEASPARGGNRPSNGIRSGLPRKPVARSNEPRNNDSRSAGPRSNNTRGNASRKPVANRSSSRPATGAARPASNSGSNSGAAGSSSSGDQSRNSGKHRPKKRRFASSGR